MVKGWWRLTRDELEQATMRATGADLSTARKIIGIETGTWFGDVVALDEHGQPIPRPHRQLTEFR